MARIYRQVSLEQRKAKLEKVLARTEGMRFSEHLDGDGQTIFKQPAKWDWKASFRSEEILGIGTDEQKVG